MSGKPGRSGARYKYPWPDMKPGQQKVFSGNARSIQAAACAFARKVGAKFKTWTVESYLIVRRVR